MEQSKPIPFSLSPESSRPKIVYLPSFNNIIVPGKTVVLEDLVYMGHPRQTYEGTVVDKVETTQKTASGEVVGRTVHMAPSLFIEQDIRRYFSHARQAALLSDVMSAYEWVLDENSITITSKPEPGEQYGNSATFTLLVDTDNEGSPYTDIFPAVSDRFYLEDNPDRVTLRHIETDDGKLLFEKIVHLEDGPKGHTFPVYAGVLYSPDLLEYPRLHDLISSPKYVPSSIRNHILPFLHIKHD